MRFWENQQYLDDIRYVAELALPWEKLYNKSMLISGATGLVGSFLVDVLLKRNKEWNMNCKVYALGRDKERAQSRF